MTIGERIKERRIELGMTQDELAQKVGYRSRSSINKIELSRELPLSKVTIMAKALDTTETELMGWEDNEHEEQARRLMIYANAFVRKYFKLTDQNKRIVDNLILSLLEAQGGSNED